MSGSEEYNLQNRSALMVTIVSNAQGQFDPMCHAVCKWVGAIDLFARS